MKKLFTIFLLTAISIIGFAQDVDEVVVSSLISDSTVLKKTATSFNKKLKTGFDVNMGYMFSKFGGGPFLSLAPHVSYPLSEKFWINAGVSVGYGNFYNPLSFTSGEQPNILPMTKMFLYASGNYQATDKLVITGSAYKYIMDVKNPNGSNNPAQSAYSYQGVSLGFSYNITNNITFGVQMHFDSPHPNNSYHSPFGTGYYAPPYGW